MPQVNKKKCISCKKCVRKCPVDAIEIVKTKALIDEDRCVNCGKCIKVCPVKAILGDKEIVSAYVEFSLGEVKNSLSGYGSKKIKRRMIRNQMRQLKRQQAIIRGTMKGLKKIKL